MDNAESPVPGRWIKLAIISVLATANVAVVWFSAQSLALSKQQYELSAETHAANIAEAVKENLHSGFEKLELVLGSVAEEMGRQIRGNRLSKASMTEFAKNVKPTLPGMNALVISDAKGDTWTTAGVVGPNINVADLDYFIQSRDGPGSGLIVTKLLKSRLSGRYIVLGAHAVRGRDQQFAGVVVGSYLVSYFQSTLSVYDLGPQGRITLRDTDGLLIARYGDTLGRDPEPAGSRNISDDFRRFAASGQSFTTLHSPLAGLWNQRISTLRRLDEEPLIITVSVDNEDYLKGWWDQLRTTASLELGFLVLSLATGFLLVRAVSRVVRDQVLFLEARDMAESSNLAKGRFLANMSHELRTPMNAVLGMHELLLGTEMTAKQRDYVTKSRSAAASLLAILNSILDFSKIEANKLDLETVPFALDTLLQELSVVASSNLGEKEIELLYNIDPAIPVELVGDPLRLKQILINLCTNAIKFTQSGEIIVSLGLVSRSQTSALILFSVTDTGLGISDEQMKIIFQAFSQADVSTSRRFGGTGLGLTISQRLVRMMGGSIAVESEPGKGSRFSFALNLPTAPLPVEPQPVPPQLQRVLISSRSPEARKVFAAMAQTAGWEADIRSTVAEALESPTNWAAALVDLHLSTPDHWKACAQLHAVAPKAVVLAVVNLHQHEVLWASPSSFDALLVKPFTVPMMVRAVEEALHSSSLPDRVPGVQGPRRLEGVRLLLAEDNPLNQLVATELLKSEGADVLLAVDGNEAVKRVLEAKVPFDAALMDMRMPDLDGLDATRLIRHTLTPGQLPIIAMTANALPSDKAACFEAGMDDHIAKPIDREILVETLLRFVKKEEIVFDSTAALERFGGNRATLQKVLSYWLKTAKALPDELGNTAGDADKLIRFYHSLKGSAATVGGTALSKHAGRLETRLTSDPAFQWETDGRETEARTAALVAQIEGYLASL